MAEYSYDYVNFIGGTERVANAIGKECYYGFSAKQVLENAQNDRGSSILKWVNNNNYKPFRDTQGGWYPFMIVKKEPASRYVPFKSKEEFVERYKEVMEVVEFNSFEDNLFLCGMWLKHADDDPNKSVYRLVSLIKDEGVRIPEWGFFDWGELLLAGFLFLDDTPCGRRKNDKD